MPGLTTRLQRAGAKIERVAGVLLVVLGVLLFTGPCAHESSLTAVEPPILHLSLPVTDLAEARAFYVDVLGCRLGRHGDEGADVWFYGLQLTLQYRPDEVLLESQRGVRHFGVTLSLDALADVLARLERFPIRWLSRVSTDHAGTPQEQTKAKLLDPSGNVIEIKAYADLVAGLQAI